MKIKAKMSYSWRIGGGFVLRTDLAVSNKTQTQVFEVVFIDFHAGFIHNCLVKNTKRLLGRYED